MSEECTTTAPDTHLEQIAALSESDTITALADPNHRDMPPTAVPCPDWCDSPRGHSYESLDVVDNSEVRYHAKDFRDDSSAEDVRVDAATLATWRQGSEHQDDTKISAWLDGNNALWDITPERAVVLGPLMTRAGQWAIDQRNKAV